MPLFHWLFLLAPAGSPPLLSASTEAPTPGEDIPPPGLAEFVLSRADASDRENFAECLDRLSLTARDLPRLFRSVALPPLMRGERLHFLRPALDPYCHTFYGAHLFRYWLVAERNAGEPRFAIEFAGGGDAFEVLPETHGGHYELSMTNCFGGGCLTAWLRHDGHQYANHRCSELRVNDQGQEIEQDYPCRWCSRPQRMRAGRLRPSLENASGRP